MRALGRCGCCDVMSGRAAGETALAFISEQNPNAAIFDFFTCNAVETSPKPQNAMRVLRYWAAKSKMAVFTAQQTGR